MESPRPETDTRQVGSQFPIVQMLLAVVLLTLSAILLILHHNLPGIAALLAGGVLCFINMRSR